MRAKTRQNLGKGEKKPDCFGRRQRISQCNSLDFGPFLFLLIYLVLALFFFWSGSVALPPGKSSSFLLPNGSSFSKPCQDHVTSLLDQTLKFFSRQYSFFLKGITLSALGCEATYISVHLKIPK